MTTRPIGLSRDLPPKRVMRANVDGQDMVIWRAADGTIAAWDNRCPHRGMALSHGFVRGNSLACLYHGWHYAASGRCALIPAHPDLDPPETIHATAFDVRESGGVIWVSATGPIEATIADLPALTPLRSFLVEAPTAAVQRAVTQVPLAGTFAVARDGALYDMAGTTIAILCNPMDTTTQVTVLVEPNAARDAQKTLSRWCEAMRRNAETRENA